MDYVEQSIVENKLPMESEHLEALERMRALDAYYQWSLSLLQPWVGRRVLDAGCGIGNGTEILALTADYILAADLSPQNVAVLRNRFVDCANVEPMQVDLESDLSGLADRKFDTVLCMDVLEHIEDDVSQLKRFREIVVPGGHLLIKVPALMWLFGSIDRASGHFRRYNKKSLAGVARDAGWKPIHTQYMNCLGVLPYFLKSRLLGINSNFSRSFTPKQLDRIRRVIPYLRRIDKLTGSPVGQSVILVAQNAD